MYSYTLLKKNYLLPRQSCISDILGACLHKHVVCSKLGCKSALHYNAALIVHVDPLIYTNSSLVCFDLTCFEMGLDQCFSDAATMAACALQGLFLQAQPSGWLLVGRRGMGQSRGPSLDTQMLEEQAAGEFPTFPEAVGVGLQPWSGRWKAPATGLWAPFPELITAPITSGLQCLP